MASFKANGDPLEGTIAVPNYPDPATQNVNAHPLDWAYGDGNDSFDTNPPSAPTSLASPSHTATSVHLGWTASTDDTAVAYYNIYSDSTVIGSTGNVTATISGLTSGTTYNFSVSAVDDYGHESARSAAVAVTPS